MSSKLGEALKDIRIPGEIVAQVIDSLRRDQERVRREFTARKERLEKHLELTRRRQDQAYKDKLDDKITEEFWNRQMSELTANEQRTASALAALAEPLTGCGKIVLSQQFLGRFELCGGFRASEA